MYFFSFCIIKRHRNDPGAKQRGFLIEQEKKYMDIFEKQINWLLEDFVRIILRSVRLGFIKLRIGIFEKEFIVHDKVISICVKVKDVRVIQ